MAAASGNSAVSEAVNVTGCSSVFLAGFLPPARIRCRTIISICRCRSETAGTCGSPRTMDSFVAPKSISFASLA